MSFMTELNTILNPIAPVETGVFSGIAPNEYIVITPMVEYAAVTADNRPVIDVHEARIMLYTKNNYIAQKNRIIKALLDNNFVVIDRRYVGYYEDTKYHSFAVDAAKEYFTEVELDG